MIRNFVNSYKLKKFYAKLIPQNQLCFDIGANIGKKSAVLLKIGAKVVAFEPQKSCNPYLEKLKLKYNNFTFRNVAIDKMNGKNTLVLSNYSEIATLSDSFVEIHKNVDWGKKERVETITINKAIELYGLPFYCKIDVEGYEFEILSVLKHDIPLIEFEVVAGFQDKAIAILELLNRSETHFNYTLSEQPAFKSKTWLKLDQMKEVIASLPKQRVHANIFVRNF